MGVLQSKDMRVPQRLCLHQIAAFHSTSSYATAVMCNTRRWLVCKLVHVVATGRLQHDSAPSYLHELLLTCDNVPHALDTSFSHACKCLRMGPDCHATAGEFLVVFCILEQRTRMPMYMSSASSRGPFSGSRNSYSGGINSSGGPEGLGLSAHSGSHSFSDSWSFCSCTMRMVPSGPVISRT